MGLAEYIEKFGRVMYIHEIQVYKLDIKSNSEKKVVKIQPMSVYKTTQKVG